MEGNGGLGNKCGLNVDGFLLGTGLNMFKGRPELKSNEPKWFDTGDFDVDGFLVVKRL